MIEHLEMAFEHLADLVAEQLGIDHRDLPGAGAAGGLGYGLATFCQAQLLSGFAIVADALRLEERIAASDLVITGEGRLDAQTLYGKAPAEVARLAKKYGKPVAVVCGQRDGRGRPLRVVRLRHRARIPGAFPSALPQQCRRPGGPRRRADRGVGRKSRVSCRWIGNAHPYRIATHRSLRYSLMAAPSRRCPAFSIILAFRAPNGMSR